MKNLKQRGVHIYKIQGVYICSPCITSTMTVSVVFFRGSSPFQVVKRNSYFPFVSPDTVTFLLSVLSKWAVFGPLEIKKCNHDFILLYFPFFSIFNTVVPLRPTIRFPIFCKCLCPL